jgi:dihydrofolate reductase
VARGFANIGAWILGRNMFGPVRGAWPDHTWTGWWGDNPPYHTPVFVLTHHPRPSVARDGGTTFHFVTDRIHAALQRAIDASNGRDIRLGGGVATIRQYLQAELVDEMHLAISPILLGSGEHLLAGIDMLALGYQCTKHVTTANRCTSFSRSESSPTPPGTRRERVHVARTPEAINVSINDTSRAAHERSGSKAGS